jgi:uncharacterized protein involved in exopolysaccharide biosynthesis
VSTSTSSRGWEQDGPEQSLWDFLRALLGHWLVGVAVFAASILIGASVYVFAPRVYEATALLAPAKEVSSNGALGGLAGRIGGLASLAGVELPDPQAEVEVALARLQSQGFLQAFLAENDVLRTLYPERVGPARSGDPPTLQEGYLKFREDVLTIGRDRQAGLVELQIRWTDPDTAVAWCTKLVARINQEMRQTAEQEAQKSIEFLNRELERTPVLETRQSIYQLLESQVNQLMIANVREDFVFRLVDPPHKSDADKFVAPSLVVVASASLLLGGLCALFAMAAAHAVAGRRTSVAGK